jgi:hypothetical protein
VINQDEKNYANDQNQQRQPELFISEDCFGDVRLHGGRNYTPWRAMRPLQDW